MSTILIGLALALVSATQHPSVPSIERIATMSVARSAHTASALPSGAVLVAGGMASGGGSLGSAEVIDAAEGTVVEVPPMTHRRAGHTATVLPDARIVVAGGYDGTYLSSVEVFDPAQGRFHPLGTLIEARSGHTATLLADGRILIAGGVGRGWTFLSSAELFDPRTGRSELVPSMAVERESHTATALPDGRVLVAGGHRGRRQAMEVYGSAEIYDPATRAFTLTGGLGTPRHKHDAVLMADGRVLMLGGADRTDRVTFASTEIYDPERGTFEPGPTMAERRYKIRDTAVVLPGGDVLVAGGGRTAERLDAKTRTFDPVAGDFPAAFAFATATLLPGGDVLIAGGYTADNQATNGVWLFHGGR